MNNKDFGKFISALRKEKGLTQKELGEKLNLTDKAISRWENGKSYPDIEMLESISKELDVSISELIACKRIETKEEAITITEVAYIVEAKQGKKNKKFYYSLISIILIIVIILSGVIVHISKENNSEYYSQKLGIVCTDIVSSLNNISAAIDCDDYLLSDFNLVCNGQNEIEVLYLSGNCENMDRHYVSTMSNIEYTKIDYCKLYKSKKNIKEYEIGPDLKTIIEMFKVLNISSIDSDYDESKRYGIDLILPYFNYETVQDDKTYLFKDGKIIKQIRGNKISGTYANVEIYELNSNSLAEILIPTSSNESLKTIENFFSCYEQSDLEGMKRYSTNEFQKSYFHNGDVFGFSQAKLLSIYELSYDSENKIWMYGIKLEAEPTETSAFYDNGKKVEVVLSFLVAKQNGHYYINGVTTE